VQTRTGARYHDRPSMSCLLLLTLLAADEPKNGTFTETWPSGKPKLEERYKEGRRHGLLRRWHENGTLAAHEEYEEGRWEGRRAAWHENGQEQFDWRYRDGKLDEGTWKVFHANGACWTEYRVGPGGKVPDQVQTAYHDNGKLEYRGKWKDELQEGKWDYFDRDGWRREQRHYRKGQLHGRLTIWNEKGEVVRQEEWRNGKRKE